MAGDTAALLAGLADEDGANRGLAAWALGLCCPAEKKAEAAAALALLADESAGETAEVALFLDGELLRTTAGALARQALSRLA